MRAPRVATAANQQMATMPETSALNLRDVDPGGRIERATGSRKTQQDDQCGNDVEQQTSG